MNNIPNHVPQRIVSSSEWWRWCLEEFSEVQDAQNKKKKQLHTSVDAHKSFQKSRECSEWEKKKKQPRTSIANLRLQRMLKLAAMTNPNSSSSCRCGSNDFQGYFDDAKESRIKQIPKIHNQVSRIKIQDLRIKFQESRFKNNQDQDSRLKIQESREDSIKISIKKIFQNIG